MKKESFEENLINLETIIRELENGNVDLEDSINKYKEAMDLIKKCDEVLSNATKTINKVMKSEENIKNFEIEN